MTTFSEYIKKRIPRKDTEAYREASAAAQAMFEDSQAIAPDPVFTGKGEIVTKYKDCVDIQGPANNGPHPLDGWAAAEPTREQLLLAEQVQMQYKKKMAKHMVLQNMEQNQQQCWT